MSKRITLLTVHRHLLCELHLILKTSLIMQPPKDSASAVNMTNGHSNEHHLSLQSCHHQQSRDMQSMFVMYISLDVNLYICQLVTQVNASHVCWQLSVKPIDICRAYRKIWGFTKIMLSYLTILVSNNCNQREAPRNNFRMFGCVSPITSLLCQNEMRTRERMECQSIRTV